MVLDKSSLKAKDAFNTYNNPFLTFKQSSKNWRQLPEYSSIWKHLSFAFTGIGKNGFSGLFTVSLNKYNINPFSLDG
jgi:hypothetical protein